jgi:hypothetical protein
MANAVHVLVTHNHSPLEDAFTEHLITYLGAQGIEAKDDKGDSEDTRESTIRELLADCQWLVFVLAGGRGLEATPRAMQMLSIAAQLHVRVMFAWLSPPLHERFRQAFAAVDSAPIDIDAGGDWESAANLILQELRPQDTRDTRPIGEDQTIPSDEEAGEAIIAADMTEMSAAEAPHLPALPPSELTPPDGGSSVDVSGPGHPITITDHDGRVWDVVEQVDGRTDLVPRATFTSHYPREVALHEEDRLLVFIALEATAAQVEAMAAERLGTRHGEYRVARAPTPTKLKRGARLTIIPNLPGFRFDPVSVTAEWLFDIQCYEFRLRAEDAQPGLAVNGYITILEGPVLRGEIPMAIFVGTTHQPPAGSEHFTRADVRAYRDTFPSYSRKDEHVVHACETVVEAGGDRFLRDVRKLRSGEEWEPRLLELIDQADVFQLFWSRNAAESPQVEREWRHALTLRPERPNFIRPVYWSPKPYPIPPELQPINLGRLYPEILGLGRPSWLSRMLRRDE